jgi:glucose/arabinose dehydrogenase
MRGTMRLCLVIASGLILSACETEPAEQATEELPADTVAAEPTISLADVAGTWDMRSVPETGDTTATVYQVEATPDGWTLMLPDRDPIEAEVTTSGDSILVVAGPYESVRRDGVRVTTHSVYRLEGERLVGTVVARYETTEADSVLRLTAEGTRSP